MHLCFQTCLVHFTVLETFGEALWLQYVLCEKKMFYVLFILSDDG